MTIKYRRLYVRTGVRRSDRVLDLKSGKVPNVSVSPLPIRATNRRPAGASDDIKPQCSRFAQAYRIDPAAGHGRLMEPPSRNSMWRFGYPNPVDYNDNELFCGGYSGTVWRSRGTRRRRRTAPNCFGHSADVGE